MPAPSFNYSTSFPDESPEEFIDPTDPLHSLGQDGIVSLGFFFDENGEEDPPPLRTPRGRLL